MIFIDSDDDGELLTDAKTIRSGPTNHNSDFIDTSGVKTSPTKRVFDRMSSVLANSVFWGASTGSKDQMVCSYSPFD